MNEAKTRYEIMAGDVMDKVEDLCVAIYQQGYEDASAEQYEAGYEAGFAAGKRRTGRKAQELVGNLVFVSSLISSKHIG